jgi:hypothetical protein
MFISGDRHLTELMQIKENEIGYTTYELTTSGIHAKVYPLGNNPRRILGRGGKINYALIEPKNQNGALWVDIKSYSLDKELLFEKSIKVMR